MDFKPLLLASTYNYTVCLRYNFETYKVFGAIIEKQVSLRYRN